jgi:hypothetical protein
LDGDLVVVLPFHFAGYPPRPSLDDRDSGRTQYCGEPSRPNYILFGLDSEPESLDGEQVWGVKMIHKPVAQGIEFATRIRGQYFIGLFEIAEHSVWLSLVLKADPLNGCADR